VSKVTVTAAAANVEKGGKLQFTAAVEGTGLDGDPAYKDVIWSIGTSGIHTGTTVLDGELTVAADESQYSLYIKAVSVLDSNKTGKASVSVITQDPVPLDNLSYYVGFLPANSPEEPYPVKLEPFTLNDDNMELLKRSVEGRSSYITLDLSACSLEGNGTSLNSGDLMKIAGTVNIVGIILPDSITSIGENAFGRQANLKSIVIPGSVESIGRLAFYGCTSLVSVTFAAGSAITGENFSTLTPFDSYLHQIYLAPDGGPGTYMRSSYGSAWTEQ
jgi:hypothetical protein